MCSIVGIQGNFKGNDLIKMLKVSKNRGPDASGVYLDDVYSDIDLDNFDDDNEYEIGLGHNLLSIYDLYDRKSITQPVRNDNLVICLKNLSKMGKIGFLKCRFCPDL